MIEIREPKYKVGDKVYCKQYESSAIITGVSDYSFNKDKYFHFVEWEDGNYLDEISEDLLEPYTEKPKSVWDLKEGDTYYVICGYGEVLETTWKYNIDSNSRKIGNAFLTKEEAEYELERRKIETEMIKLGGRRKFKHDGDNYGLYYCEGTNNITLCRHTLYQGLIYFDSIEEASNAIETIGEERIKKYIFGVES